MKVKCIMGAIVGLMLLLSAGRAADWNERWRYDRNSDDKFKEPDVTLDLFGTWANQNRHGNDDRFGGGLGVTAYFVRYVGIGADTWIDEWKAPYRANANLLLRVPIGQSGLAPYAIGGGGREWKYIPQWSLHAGGGLQLKLNQYTALFGDWRRVFPEDTPDFHLVRFGLNVGF
ncbi:MAG TPA: hypothetical protein VJ063_10980 [Verrucomicrobiae bacterium]|nr:hypothetical protein [Verrucomicrobiae bacterium]